MVVAYAKLKSALSEHPETLDKSNALFRRLKMPSSFTRTITAINSNDPSDSGDSSDTSDSEIQAIASKPCKKSTKTLERDQVRHRSFQ